MVTFKPYTCYVCGKTMQRGTSDAYITSNGIYVRVHKPKTQKICTDMKNRMEIAKQIHSLDKNHFPLNLMLPL